MIESKNVRRLHFIMIIIYHYDKIGRVGVLIIKYNFPFHFLILKFYFLKFYLIQKGGNGIIRIQERKEGRKCILDVTVN